MNDNYYSSELREIPYINLIEGIGELIKSTILDYGKSVTHESQEHLIIQTKRELSSWRYKSWKWEEVEAAFKLGKMGKYGGESRVNFVNVMRWLDGYNENRMKLIVEKQVSQKKLLSQLTEKILGGDKYANAVLWKNFSCTKEERHKFNELREKGINVIQMIVDDFENGIDPKTKINN